MPNLADLINTPTAGRRSGNYPALWNGIIEAATEGRIWVRVPSLSAETIPATNAIPNSLQPGDRVIVGLLESKIDALVVLAAMTPGIPAHTHTLADITLPAWEPLELGPNWWGPWLDDTYQGLRHRRVGDMVEINGTIKGNPDLIAQTPYRPLHSTTFAALLDGWVVPNGSTAAVTLHKDGRLTTEVPGILHINVSAPLG